MEVSAAASSVAPKATDRKAFYRPVDDCELAVSPCGRMIAVGAWQGRTEGHRYQEISAIKKRFSLAPISVQVKFCFGASRRTQRTGRDHCQAGLLSPVLSLAHLHASTGERKGVVIPVSGLGRICTPIKSDFGVFLRVVPFSVATPNKQPPSNRPAGRRSHSAKSLTFRASELIAFHDFGSPGPKIILDLVSYGAGGILFRGKRRYGLRFLFPDDRHGLAD